MQVLGDLIRIPRDGDDLPLPWWHRAPLGLSHNTGVFVVITKEEGTRPVGDLLVTVLNPSRWDRMFRLECNRWDEPGLLTQVFHLVYPLNIALAEAVTTEGTGLHNIGLICEPAHRQQDMEAEVERIGGELKQAGFTFFKPARLALPVLPDDAWRRSARVELLP